MFEIPCKLGHGQVLQVFHDVPTGLPDYRTLMCTFSSVDIATGSPPVFKSDPIIQDHPRARSKHVLTCQDMEKIWRKYGENVENVLGSED